MLLLLWILNASGSHIVHWAWNKLSRALSDLGNSSRMWGESREAFLRANNTWEIMIWYNLNGLWERQYCKERSNGNKHRNALNNVSLRTFKNNMLKDASMHLQALVVVAVHRLQTGQVVAAQASSEWDDAAPRAHSLWRSKMLRISWCLTALFVDQVHPGMS